MLKKLGLVGIGVGLSIVYFYIEDKIWLYRRNKKKSSKP